jgi:hypothetical protein
VDFCAASDAGIKELKPIIEIQNEINTENNQQPRPSG